MRTLSTIALLGCALCLEAATTRVTLHQRDSLLWVEVTTPATPRPLHCLLDSGATVSVLDTSTCQELGLPLGRAVPVQGVARSVTGYWPTRWKARLGNLPLPRQVLALDLQALSQTCQRRIDGLVGLDFLRRQAVELDWARQELILNPPPSQRTGLALPLEIRGSAVGLRARTPSMNPVWLRLDTGCAAALHLVHPHSASPTAPQTTAVGLAPVTLTSSLTPLRVAGRTYHDLPTQLHPAPIFPGEDGLLGLGFLTRHPRVLIDFPRKKLLLEDPSAATPETQSAMP